MQAYGAWRVGKCDDAATYAIWKSGCCRRLTAALLSARGIRTPEEAREFLREDAGLLHDQLELRNLLSICVALTHLAACVVVTADYLIFRRLADSLVIGDAAGNHVDAHVCR